jgi:hypothetical protein
MHMEIESVKHECEYFPCSRNECKEGSQIYERGI